MGVSVLCLGMQCMNCNIVYIVCIVYFVYGICVVCFVYGICVCGTFTAYMYVCYMRMYAICVCMYAIYGCMLYVYVCYICMYAICVCMLYIYVYVRMRDVSACMYV